MYIMKERLIENPDEFYRLAEQEAANYFKSLQEEVKNKKYVTYLTKDIGSWKHNHIRDYSIFSIFSRKKDKTYENDYNTYIKWLDYTGKLDNYLDRSISYIYMRDLGKALDSPDTKERIKRSVNNLKNHITKNQDKKDTFSMALLYRRSQEEGIESTMIWLINKLKTVSMNIPNGMDSEHAQRKLIKIIAGVVMHQLEEMDDNVPRDERRERLTKAIRLGYSYGLTYPFIDDLLDAKVLSSGEEKKYSDIIRDSLITGEIKEIDNWAGSNGDLMKFIQSELNEAFQYIRDNQSQDSKKSFFKKAYVFFNSQEVDRKKYLSNENYTNEEIYIPIILKSAASRLITRSVVNSSEDTGFDSRTFYYGIYNQLADDFADMFDDFNAGAVTPYTYYMKYHKLRHDLINPFELYWGVIYNLIHNVYNSDPKTCEVILDRAINGLKRFKEKMGEEKYSEVMDVFSSFNTRFNNLIQNMVKKADDVDFFDKLLRDHIINTLRKDKREQEEFIDTVKGLKEEINDILMIKTDEGLAGINEPIVDAANYSLQGDGKRLRPIMAWVMGTGAYGLEKSSLIPLIKSLEYMHTASLIFDDLPSQDNASSRRGRDTLHMVYNTAVAELTGLFLTQMAVEEQASLKGFDSNDIIKLVKYSASMTGDMCKGQAIDLESKGKKLTLEELNLMCFYKTGKAFEASLVMPAILGHAKEDEIKALKRYSYHAGIAFQIKDDLLDVEGDQNLIGKPIGIDVENNSSTFASILGLAEAKKEMWDHYCLAMEALRDVPKGSEFLKHLLNYIINRDY